MTSKVVVCLLLGTFFAACNKQSAEKSGSEGAAKSEPALIAGAAAGPTGYQWARVNRAAAGSVEVPSGEGWKKEDGASLEVSNEKLGITIMVQTQGDVPAEAREEYLKSLIDVNKRDAPKYAVVAQKLGQVQAQPAGMVDGKFDNGSAFATRDYVLFAKNAAFAIMVRGPAAQETEVHAVADHVAASRQ